MNNPFERLKKARIPIRWKLNIVGSIIIVCFAIVLYGFVLPLLAKEKEAERKDKLRAVVDSAVSIMAFYENEIRDDNYKNTGLLPLTRDEAKKRAIFILSQIRYDETDYLFILDGNCNLVMHPFKNEMEGVNMAEVASPDGSHPFRELALLAQVHGDTFVDYTWLSKWSRTVNERQTTYARYFYPWDWVVCSSVYTQDILEASRRFTLIASLYFGAGIIIAAVLLFFLGRLLTNPVIRLSKSARLISLDPNEPMQANVTVSANDEIGDLAQSFNEMGHKLGRTFESLKMEISERKATEKALRRSEEKYRDLVQNANSVILRMDSEGKITFFNEYAQEFFGYAEEEILGRNVVGSIVPEYESTGRDLRALLADICKHPGNYSYNENENVKSNGEVVWVSWSNRVVRVGPGKPPEVLCVGTDITSRVQAETALRRSEERYRAMFGHLRSGVAVYRGGKTEDDLVILDFNRAAEQLTGRKRADVLGKSVTDLFPDMKGSKLFAALLRVYRTGEPRNLPAFSYQDENMERQWRENFLYKLPSGEVVSLFNDVTEREVSRRRMLMETFILEILNLEKDLSVLVRKILSVIKVYTQMDAVAIRLRSGMDTPYYSTKGFSNDFIRQESSLLGQDGPVKEECREACRLEGMCGIVIQGRTKREQDFFTRNGSFWTSNLSDLHAKGLGREYAGILRNRCSMEGYESIALIPLRSGQEIIGLLQLNSRSKGRLSESLVHFLEGVCVSIGVALGRHLIEEERIRLTSLMEASDDCIIMTDMAGEIFYVNPAGLTLMGLEGLDQARGLPAFDLVEFGEMAKHYDATGRSQTKSGFWRGSGSLACRERKQSIPVEINFFVVHERNEERPNCLAMLIQDASSKLRMEEEKKGLEAQLLHSQKIEAIGTLAGGIAHDFNNILGVIIAYAQALKLDLPKEAKAFRHASHILQASDRAKDLVAQILAFSRQSDMEWKPFYIELVLDETLKFLRASLPSTIDIRVHRDEDLGMIRGDPTQIQQIMMNLCTNAHHAMNSKGGTLEIRLETRKLSPDDPLCTRGLKPETYQVLTVRDTGMGMSPQTLERIFDPYFTTKAKGDGTGLGLAVVHGIVKSHQGQIEVESQLGKGTAFRVYLPSMEPEEKAGEEGDVDSFAQMEGSGNVLFVDDEPLLADSYAELLESLGYQVTKSTSPVEALERVRQEPARFNLVISDQTMPHMKGEELARQIHELAPQIPIILCTGFSANLKLEDVRSRGVVSIAHKPINLPELAELMKRAMENGR